MRATSRSRLPASTATPSTTTVPASGAARPRMRRSTVDLPDPLEPSSTWVAPGGTSRETESSATVAPKRLVTSRRAITPAFYRPRVKA